MPQRGYLFVEARKNKIMPGTGYPIASLADRFVNQRVAHIKHGVSLGIILQTGSPTGGIAKGGGARLPTGGRFREGFPYREDVEGLNP